MLNSFAADLMIVDRHALVLKLVDRHGEPRASIGNLSVGSCWYDSVDPFFHQGAVEAHSLCMAGFNPHIIVKLKDDESEFPNFYKLRLAGCPSSSGEIGQAAITVEPAPTIAKTMAAVGSDDDAFLDELETFYAAANLGFCLLDRDLRYVRINQVLATINRIPVADHLGRRISDLLPDVFAMIKELLQGVMESGQPILNVPMQAENPRRFFQVVDCFVSFLPIRNAQGEIAHVGIIVEEGTALVNEKKARMIAEERTNQLIETCNHGIAVIGEDHSLLKVNSVLSTLLGYDQNELLGKHVSVLVDPSYSEDFLGEITARMNSKGNPTDLRLRSKDGEFFWVDLATFVIKKLITNEFEGLCLIFSDISARKAAELELRRSEERQSLASHIAQLGYFEWNQATQVIHWSPSLYELLEVTPSPDLDRHHGFRCRVHPGDRERLVETVEAAIRNRSEYNIKYRLLLPNGKLKHVEEFGLIRIDQGPRGNEVVLHGTIQDITFLWNSQTKVHENEERFRLALEAGGMEAWEFDWNARRLLVPAALADLLRIDTSKLTTRQALRKVLGYFGEKERRRFLRGVLRSIRSGKPQELEVQLHLGPRLDQEFLIMWKAQLDGNTASPARLIGVIRDISVKKQLERQKTESEMQFSKILETSLEGAWFLDRKGKTTRTNGTLSRILGYSASEMMGKSYLRFIKSSSRADAIKFFKKSREGVGGVADLCFVHKNGFDIWVILSCSPIPNYRGEFSGLFCLVTEITARKKLEEELIRAREEAEIANRIKTQFLANMSHELRTPIAAILGYSEILNESEFKNGINSFVIDGIRTNSEHMVRLIDNVLDIAKIEAGRIDIHPTWESPTQLLDETCKICEVRAEASGVRLMTFVTPPMPKICRFDATRLRQILINLVNNAIKFSDPGSTVSLELRSMFERNQLNLLFDVRDEGIGIKLEDQEKLFKPFSQVDGSMTRKHEGVGLGLALSDKLARAMDGSISLVSIENKGSIFTVTIPIQQYSEIETKPVDENDALMSNPSNRGFDPTNSRGVGSILVVEDNAGSS